MKEVVLLTIAIAVDFVFVDWCSAYSSKTGHLISSKEDDPNYDFVYSVNHGPSGLDFGHEEHRDERVTRGRYFVLLPDGRRQIVTYYVRGDSGFVAQVHYENEPLVPFDPLFRSDLPATS